jgi:ABC-type transporter Mla MlaB component
VLYRNGTQETMWRIEQSSNRRVFSLGGRIQADDVAELQKLLSLEAPGDTISLDLQDITVVDREAVKFLARCESESIRLENCPAYIRQWIDTERGVSSQHKSGPR